MRTTAGKPDESTLVFPLLLSGTPRMTHEYFSSFLYLVKFNLASALNYFLHVFFFCTISTAQSTTFAYITNQISDTVSVIDTSSNQLIANLNVGHRPAGVAASSDGKF